MAALNEFISKHGITMEHTFIPWTLSRRAGEKHPSLNYRITLYSNASVMRTAGPIVRDVQYSMERMETPSYIRALRTRGALIDENVQAAIRTECVTGKGPDGPIAPNIRDVLSMMADYSFAIEFPTFKEWAEDGGSDPDSRRAEARYRKCLRIGLSLRLHLGEQGLTELRKATGWMK